MYKKYFKPLIFILITGILGFAMSMYYHYGQRIVNLEEMVIHLEEMFTAYMD